MKTEVRKVLVTIPVPLLKKLDARAAAERHSRSKEMERRLTATFKRGSASKVAP